MNNRVLARKKRFFHCFDSVMKKIWVTLENDSRIGNYALIHFLDHSVLFGEQYLSCESQSDLNDIKSKSLNNGFRLDWNEFEKTMRWINDH